jgi:DNA adenine methylase Dam
LEELFIKSPINYIGNKYKLIKQIIPLFPKHINTFVDIFGGSGTVLINTKAKYYLYNDINQYVSSIFKGLVTEDTDEIIRKIETIITEYSLSKTNKEGFEKLREDYNNGRNDWITLYTLMCHSFNHQFRFNSNHKYNSSFGSIRAYFSECQKNDLFQMKQKINTNIIFSQKDFKDINYSNFGLNDLLYFDPPYLASVGNYNDGKRGFDGWTEEHDKKLLGILDSLNEQGIRWALSNNLKYDNPFLCKWKDKYAIHYLSGDYVNSHYNKKDRSKDIEVLITNY